MDHKFHSKLTLDNMKNRQNCMTMPHVSYQSSQFPMSVHRVMTRLEIIPESGKETHGYRTNQFLGEMILQISP